MAAELPSSASGAGRARRRARLRPRPGPISGCCSRRSSGRRSTSLAQKATELGVAALLPGDDRAHRAERVNLERLRANAIEAAEQSERLRCRDRAAPVPLDARARRLAADAPLLAVRRDRRGRRRSREALRGRAGPAPWAVLIGPEGGFARRSLTLCGKLPFVTGSASVRASLRADTAALAALACWQAFDRGLALTDAADAPTSHIGSPQAACPARRPPRRTPDRRPARPDRPSRVAAASRRRSGASAPSTRNSSSTCSDLTPVPYDGPRGIRALLQGLTRFGWKPVVEGGNIIALQGGPCSITLEPGGQFELSGAPLETIHETCDEVHTHLAQVKEVAGELGLGLLGLGFDPKWRREDVPWMPKGRYEIMRALHAEGRQARARHDAAHLHRAGQPRLLAPKPTW